jgi:recombination protein RecR
LYCKETKPEAKYVKCIDPIPFYLTKKLADYSIKISTIARGIPIGGDLEYTDEITLGRSIVGRIVYE